MLSTMSGIQIEFAQKCDPDDLQDMFQPNMDESGYFTPLEEEG